MMNLSLSTGTRGSGTWLRVAPAHLVSEAPGSLPVNTASCGLATSFSALVRSTHAHMRTHGVSRQLGLSGTMVSHSPYAEVEDGERGWTQRLKKQKTPGLRLDLHFCHLSFLGRVCILLWTFTFTVVDFEVLAILDMVPFTLSLAVHFLPRGTSFNVSFSLLS